MHEVFFKYTLGIVEFHEVGRTLLELLHEKTLGIADFHKVGNNLHEVLHEELIVVVLYEVGVYSTYRFIVIYYILDLCHAK